MTSLHDIDIEKLGQVIESESQETQIHIDYSDRALIIYTTRVTVMKRMLKKGYKPNKVETMQGEIYSMQFEFPTKDMTKFLRGDIFRFDH